MACGYKRQMVISDEEAARQARAREMLMMSEVLAELQHGDNIIVS